MRKHKLKLPERDKWYPVSVLLYALKEAGLWHSKEQLLVLEKKGKLTLPRAPNSKASRLVNETVVIDILDAFSPGGEGEYHYEK